MINKNEIGILLNKPLLLAALLVGLTLMSKPVKTFQCKECGIILPDYKEYCGRKDGKLECGLCKGCMINICRG